MKTKLWIGLLCVMAFAAVIVALLLRRPKETLTFEIVDYVTGKQIQSASVEISRVWTRLPVGLLGINPSHVKRVPAENGVARLNGIPKMDSSCWIEVSAAGYAGALMKQHPTPESHDLDVYRIIYSQAGSNWLHDCCFEYVNRKKKFTVALEPVAGGTERADVRYSTTAPPGSEQKALSAAKRYVAAWKNQIDVKYCKFRNGHWDISLWEIPGRIGGYVDFEIAESGELLDVQHGY